MVKRRSVFGYAVLLFIFLFTVFSDVVARSALDGMLLCAKRLIPTLFPMMVLTGIALRSGIFNGLTRIGDKVLSPLFGIDGKYISSFLIGIIGSAPTGAIAAKKIGSNTESDSEKASAMLLSSLVSFGFIYSVVGLGLLNNGKRGIALFIFQLQSVMITASIIKPKKRQTAKPYTAEMKATKLSVAVASSIRDAAANMLPVCGSVIFFSALSGIVVSLPINKGFKLFVCPFLELASGLEYLSEHFPPDTTFIVASSAIGWSGLSMIFQSLSVTDGSLPSHKYIIGRAVSALLCPLIAYITIYLGII